MLSFMAGQFELVLSNGQLLASLSRFLADAIRLANDRLHDTTSRQPQDVAHVKGLHDIYSYDIIASQANPSVDRCDNGLISPNKRAN